VQNLPFTKSRPASGTYQEHDKTTILAASAGPAAKRKIEETTELRIGNMTAGELQRIGRFEIRSRVGAGAFGAVYHAYDPLLHRDVAIKVPHAHSLRTHRDFQLFDRDAAATAAPRQTHRVLTSFLIGFRCKLG
jgi:hypothetical protein